MALVLILLIIHSACYYALRVVYSIRRIPYINCTSTGNRLHNNITIYKVF